MVCLQPAGSSIRIDPSLDTYVSERFGTIERLVMPRALKLAAGGRAGIILQVPGLYHIMNRKALSAAMRLGAGRYDVVITWSQWHCVHLVGFELKRRFPGLPWIAHFSDPWSENPFTPGLMRGYDRHLEAKVYRAADILSFTSRETVDLTFRDRYAPYRAKATDLPHAFEPALYPDVSSPAAGPLILRSLGNFYGPRSPEPLFRALALLRERDPVLFGKIRVELIGSIPDEFRRGSRACQGLPPGVVHVLSPVDYRTSLGLMRSADVLLNIDAPFAHSVFLPSKLVDYIGAERPIVGITPPGTASRVIGALGGWVADPTDPEGIASVLARALTYVEYNRGVSWGAPEIRRSYAASTVAEQFGRLVRTAMGAT